MREVVATGGNAKLRNEEEEEERELRRLCGEEIDRVPVEIPRTFTRLRPELAERMSIREISNSSRVAIGPMPP